MAKSPDIQTPTPAPFFPLNVTGTADQALSQDITGFGLSDADFLARFPGLVSARTSNINTAYNQMTGPLDPTVENSFVKQGLSQSLSTYGAGQAGAPEAKGSAAQNLTSSTVANDTQGYKDYTRGVFSDLLTQNQQRGAGLSGSNIAQLSIANTGNLNQSNQANFSGSLSAQNAQNAADTAANNANTETAIAIATSIAIAI